MTATQQAIRATAIKQGRISMAHMRLSMTVEREDTPALRWGRLVHMAVLEPERIDTLRVWVGARRGKEYAAFAEEVAGLEYLRDGEKPQLDAIADSAMKAMASLPPLVHTEVYHEWTAPLYGLACCRVDAILDGGAMLEVKTCRKLSKRAFIKQAYELGYHLQLGWYDHGMAIAGYTGGRWALALESNPPYCTALYRVPDYILKAGYEEAAEIAAAYRACEVHGIFPGPYDYEVMDYELPEWANKTELDLTGLQEDDGDE